MHETYGPEGRWVADRAIEKASILFNNPASTYEDAVIRHDGWRTYRKRLMPLLLIEAQNEWDEMFK